MASNVIVTGGSRGLGLGIARRLAAGGHAVIAIARKPSDGLLSAMRGMPPEAPGSIHFRPFDLDNIAAIPGFVRGLRREFGAFYGLVNNAGVGTAGILTMMPDVQIERLLRLNTLSPLVLTKYVVRAMMIGGGGRIVSIASIVGQTGYNGVAAYSASKAALVGFTRSLAREAGPLGITVNAVAPGFVATEMTSGLNDRERAQVARRSALRRLAEVEDVAAAVEFLLGPGGKNITGTVLTVDAGNTA